MRPAEVRELERSEGEGDKVTLLKQK